MVQMNAFWKPLLGFNGITRLIGIRVRECFTGLTPDDFADVVRHLAVPVVSVWLENEVAPLLRVEIHVDVAQSGQAHVGLQSRFYTQGPML